jgi:hypothetical protein
MSESLRGPATCNESCLASLERLGAALVGAGRIWEVQERLTRVMLMEALRRTAANYTRSARLLGVQRQAIQQMVVRFELEEWAASLRGERTDRVSGLEGAAPG